MVPSILVEIITSKDQYLTATEYLCHRPPRICCSHNTILLFSPMTYHRNFNMSNTTGSIRGTRASYSSGATVSFIMFNYISLRFKFRVVKSATISTQQSCSVCLYSHVDSFVGSSSFIYLYLFMHTGVLHDFHSRRCSCHLKVTRWVPQVDQELFTFPKHPSSPLFLSLVSVALSLVFWLVWWSLYLLLSVIVLSVLHTWLPLWYLQLSSLWENSKPETSSY